MNHKIEILQTEIELEKIREEKAKLIVQMNYTEAATLRDQEKLTTQLLNKKVHNLLYQTINSNLSSTNYYKTQEIISFLSRYNLDVSLKFNQKVEKILSSLIEKNNDAIKTKGFDLSHKLNIEINFFKNI